MSAPAADPLELRVTATRTDDLTHVAVADEIDMANAGEFVAAVREHLAPSPVPLDMHELTIMDSSGVRALDALMRDASSEGWSLAIRSDLHRNVRRVLEITGMLETLALQDPPATAGPS